METTPFSNETFTSTPRNISNITDTTFNSTMNTAIQSDDNVLKAILTGSFAGVIVLVLAIFLFWIVRLRKRNRARKDGQSEEEISNELERFINADTDIRRSTSPIGIAPGLGNYSMWGKHLSDDAVFG
ncbi:uncharacterized protein LOC125677081 [Ostrea edulis]|uniref:uncharacterized protein LOC125677081 n=1 Tax=Ostrea edulis TaxID=37623 RepID=UPI0024AF7581|nr:uncharacterized protein LOC125677081 [Ostrea edulis]